MAKKNCAYCIHNKNVYRFLYIFSLVSSSLQKPLCIIVSPHLNSLLILFMNNIYNNDNNNFFVFVLQMVQAIQVLRFHLLELEKVSFEFFDTLNNLENNKFRLAILKN